VNLDDATIEIRHYRGAHVRHSWLREVWGVLHPLQMRVYYEGLFVASFFMHNICWQMWDIN